MRLKKRMKTLKMILTSLLILKPINYQKKMKKYKEKLFNKRKKKIDQMII